MMQNKEELKASFEKLLLKRGCDPSFVEDGAEVISEIVDNMLREAYSEGYTCGFSEANDLPF